MKLFFELKSYENIFRRQNHFRLPFNRRILKCLLLTSHLRFRINVKLPLKVTQHNNVNSRREESALEEYFCFIKKEHQTDKLFLKTVSEKQNFWCVTMQDGKAERKVERQKVTSSLAFAVDNFIWKVQYFKM
ncbi:CLUMA_CG021064, isoform A [Clunio marinus]|uniref:CLUMA_CG021064, isoform A n=1 Tax=Clunio marinus TaxID=568069 RepID=A0A1J1J6D9_9DIPT|nr:CLUMA_CG021064, isoform A [Clunio marinus]